MNDRSAVPRPEDLLLHAKWVRRIAAHLVVDAARADDLAQQTLLTALAQPPLRADHPRAWLASVARSLARRMHRTDERRAQHESELSPPASPPAVHEVVTQAQTQHDVVAALLALDEPYRTALLLRFFEDRPPRAIAKETQVPVETVRTRIRRGLELLRAELVRRRGDGMRGTGNRDASAWAVSLVGLLDSGMRHAVKRAVLAKAAAETAGASAGVLGGSTFAGALGVFAMTTKLKLAAALLVVAASAFTIVRLAGSPRLPPRDGVASAAHGPPELPEPVRVETPAPVVASQAARAPDKATGAPPIEKTEPLPATRVLEGIVVDAQGDPVENAVVVLQLVEHGKSEIGSLPQLCQNAEDLLHESDANAKQGHRQRTTTDIDGSFRFEGLGPSAIVDVAAIDPSRGMAVKNAIVLDAAHPSVSIELELRDGVVVHGTVRDPAGQVVPGASVMMYVRESADVLDPGEAWDGPVVIDTFCGKDGVYRTLPLPFCSFKLQFGANGFTEQTKRTPDGGTRFVPPEGVHDLQVDCVLEPAPRITGSIVRLDGTPAQLDEVRRNLSVVGSAVEPSSARGRFGLGEDGILFRPEDRYQVTCRFGRVAWVSLWSDDLMLGAAPVSETGDGPELRVDLDKIPTTAPTAALRLEVVDGRNGSPISDYVVVATHDWIAAGASEPSGKIRKGVHDAAGQALVPGLNVGTHELEVRANGYAPRCVITEVRAEPGASPLRIELLPGKRAISGSVVDERGASIAGADLCLRRLDGQIALANPECCAKSIDSGAFRFDGVPDGDFFVTAEREGLAPALVKVRGGDDHVIVMLRVGLDVKFRLVVDGDPFSATHWWRVLDAEGVPLVDTHRPGHWLVYKGSKLSVRLAAGAYSIEVITPKYRSAPTRFQAAPDLTVDVPMVPIQIPR